LLGETHGGQLKVVLRDAVEQSPASTQLAVTDIQSPDLEAGAGDARLATLETLLQHAPLLVWSRTPDGVANWAAGSISTKEGEIAASQALEMVIARQAFDPPVQDKIRRCRLEFGDTEPVALHAVEADGPDGMICGYAVDASLTASVERTLTRFIQTMTETFAHLTVGLAIFDRSHRLVLFNPTLADMWGIDAVWLARRPDLREILDRLRANRRIPHLADYHAWREQLLALFENPEVVDYEESWDLASGSRIKVMARPHPHGALAFVFDDVTEQLQLETRYRHMDDLLSTALERLDEGLLVLGPDGLLRYVNTAFHRIWDTDDEAVCTGMHAKDVFGLCSRLSIEADLWNRSIPFATGEDRRKVWTDKVTVATGLRLGVRFAPLPGGSTLVVFTDMSDSERAAEALLERSRTLEAAEEMRRTVLDQISHKLRTPLNSIFGFGQLLNDPRFGELNGRQRAYAAGIIEAAEHLLDTVNDVAELASLQSVNLGPSAEVIEIDKAIDATFEVLQGRAISAGVDFIRFEGPPVGDLSRQSLPLRQILFYLAADAIQRADRGATVTLGAERTSDDWINLFVSEVSANGAPVSAEKVEIISPVIPLVRRLANREGGQVQIVETDSAVRVVCSFRLEEEPPAMLVGMSG
ncbi:MAG: PAS domain-containing sensor histidine kinase, partial [Pseudomonadota bacterium]